MSLIKFRNMTNRPQKKSSPKPKQDLKLSFRKLAAMQDKQSIAGPAKPAEKAEPHPIANDYGKKSKGLYEESSSYLSHVMNALKNRQSFSLEPGYRILEEMAKGGHLLDELFTIAIHLDVRDKYVIHHGINVAIFALKMADDLGFDQSSKIEVGMAALLHDIGMTVIPDKIVYKQEKLSRQEIKVLKDLPNSSYKILRSFGDHSGYLAEAAAQVYERIDGSGYPRGVEGDEIHEYAQIIGLLDLYEALIHSRPHRDKVTPFAAIKEVINTCKHRFQRKHLKSLLSIFTLFPIHSYVRLDSNAIGRVIETCADQPMRPKLQILYDSQQQKVLSERIVILPDNPLLNIVDSVSVSEIQELSNS